VIKITVSTDVFAVQCEKVKFVVVVFSSDCW